ncbi:hypothetical protein HFN89_00515 [Rhizobium laguerreae]|nr:hypothetical protein [Rhizobium laguerreae]
MITFHSNKSPAKGSLVGKYVFVVGNFHYASYTNSPTLVVREMGVSVEGQLLNRTVEGGLVIATSVSDDDETRTVRRASAACICDNLEEVNAVLRANFESRNLYEASIAAGKRVFLALDGVEIKPENVTVHRTRKP